MNVKTYYTVAPAEGVVLVWIGTTPNLWRANEHIKGDTKRLKALFTCNDTPPVFVPYEVVALLTDSNGHAHSGIMTGTASHA